LSRRPHHGDESHREHRRERGEGSGEKEKKKEKERERGESVRERPECMSGKAPDRRCSILE